ncbi:MAG: D-sedoheptulose 7-phosphate isomerase [Cyclobacteriaceae bacterium]|jgi:D-sedoheptulose 7-phosphate isomerase
MNFNKLIKEELNEAEKLLNKIINQPAMINNINQAASLMVEAVKNNGKIISCGNGGSHCDAMHFAEELTGRYRGDRPPIPAIAISDPSHISCVSNDYGFENIFSRFIDAMGQPNDVLLGITTSGNSPNIINAVKSANRKGMTTIILSGNDGGQVSEISNINIIVPFSGYSDRIQEIHIKIIHIFILLLEKQLV